MNNKIILKKKIEWFQSTKSVIEKGLENKSSRKKYSKNIFKFKFGLFVLRWKGNFHGKIWKKFF